MFYLIGSGKSSLVNLLLEETKAKVSDSAVGCTFEFQKYSTEKFNLYDTVGLSEGSKWRVLLTLKEVQMLKELPIKLLISAQRPWNCKTSICCEAAYRSSEISSWRSVSITICDGKGTNQENTWWELQIVRWSNLHEKCSCCPRYHSLWNGNSSWSMVDRKSSSF